MGYLSSIASTDSLRLTYRNDKLEDGHTFESYDIGEGATIHLSRPDYAERDEAYCIYVQRTEEEVFRVRIKASDTIGSLKTRLRNGQLTPPGEKIDIWQHAENLLVIDEFDCIPWSILFRSATSNFQSTTVGRWV
jgi:Ubiquitin family